MLLNYTIIRSKRRTLAIQINPQGDLIVRSPIKLDIRNIEKFIIEKQDWIKKHQTSIQNHHQASKILTPQEIQQAKTTLKEYIIPRINTLIQGKNLPQITSIKITQSE
jgi:predicted metal-dependent hydrolase